MTYDEIIHEVTSGLTGDNEKDFKYLFGQAEKYKDHEYGKEITRAIGRMIYEVLPPEKRGEFDQLFNNHLKGTESIIEEVKFQMYKKDFNKALDIFQSYIKDLNDEKDVYPDDKKSEYHCFQNFLEELLYKVIYQPTKEIRRAPEDIAQLYFFYGNLLLEMKKYDEALIALTKAEKYNAVNTDIKFEKGEIYKIRKDWENYLEINRKCLECAYSNNAIVRAYRNISYYFSDIGEYNNAISMIFLSMHFDKGSTIAQSEIAYISDKTGKKVERPDFETIKKLLDEKNIQLGPNPLVLEICTTIGSQIKDDQPEAAIFFFSIIYELTENEGIKNLLTELQIKVSNDKK